MLNRQAFKHLKGRILYVILTLTLLGAWSSAVQAQRNNYSNPVLAGDYPDPSVIRVGNTYWATATSSEWAPEFPILRSNDLVNWEIAGAVFQQRPAWSVGNYWAPEIARHGGRYYIYYTARKKDGPLCVAVATARHPAGPYRDHGPLVCQEVGSIDAFIIPDEKGQLYMLWKEDGNSRNLPTPIWAQPLSPDGTKLKGEPKEILRNDASWEAQLIEGPFVLRRNGYFYMFYSGNACCGLQCNYALGVARARNLLGPWEKNSANPILKGNEDWKCPGHGSIVTDTRGRDFLLYHAYHPKDFVYVGRQALLDEVTWGQDGWPVINEGKGPANRERAPLGIGERNAEYSFHDEFKTSRLQPGWQWPQANQPTLRVRPAGKGWLVLSPGAMSKADDVLAAVVARSTTVGDYEATTALHAQDLPAQAVAGLAAYGDAENALGISTNKSRIMVWRREKNNHQVIAEADAPRAATIHFRVTATNGHRFRFAYSTDGRSWQNLGDELDGQHLPPWDRGVRIALTSGGSSNATAKFDRLKITPAKAMAAVK